MVEANPSLTRSQRQAQRQAERMRIAVRVEAQRRAREEVKARSGAKGGSSYATCLHGISLQWPRLSSSQMRVSSKAHRRGEGRGRAMAVGAAWRTFHILVPQRGK